MQLYRTSSILSMNLNLMIVNREYIVCRQTGKKLLQPYIDSLFSCR